MHDEFACIQPSVGHRQRIRCLEPGGLHGRERVTHIALGALKIFDQIRPRDAASRKLGVAVADVRGPPEDRANEVLEVAGGMQRQRARAVRQSGR